MCASPNGRPQENSPAEHTGGLLCVLRGCSAPSAQGRSARTLPDPANGLYQTAWLYPVEFSLHKPITNSELYTDNCVYTISEQ